MQPQSTSQPASGSGIKFVIGGALILIAIIYLIVTSTQSTAQYFLTVDELLARREEMAGQSVRISGAVLGDTITFDSQSQTLSFTIAAIPGDNEALEAQGGLAQALHDAVLDANRARLVIVYNGVKPDLLQNEAQAIITGKLGDDGVFYAEELLLKCPSRYEEAVPDQSD